MQYAVSPVAPTIYSSLISDYALDQPNVMDCFFDAVDGLRNKGFRAIKAISVITPGDQWERQMKERYADNDPSYILARLDEAERSLAWSHEQSTSHNLDHLIVINRSDNVAHNVEAVRHFVADGTVDDADDAEIERIFADMRAVIAAYRQELSQ